jgi:hypothetical protein
MSSKLEMTLQLLNHAHQTMKQNVDKVTLDEALFVPPGGYRSIMGTLKHAAGWRHVYRSFAFDPQPKPWLENHWPHGRRDTIIKSEAYWRDLIAWFDAAQQGWLENLANMDEPALDELRPCTGERKHRSMKLSGWSRTMIFITPGSSTKSSRFAGVKPGRKRRKSKRTTSPRWATASSRRGWARTQLEADSSPNTNKSLIDSWCRLWRIASAIIGATDRIFNFGCLFSGGK